MILEMGVRGVRGWDWVQFCRFRFFGVGFDGMVWDGVVFGRLGEVLNMVQMEFFWNGENEWGNISGE